MRISVLSFLLVASQLFVSEKEEVAEAIYNHDYYTIQQIVKSSKQANWVLDKNNKTSLLAYAAGLGRDEIASYLMDKDADILWRNEYNSVLNSAVAGKMDFLVEAILLKDTSFINMQDYYGLTPIAYAAQENCFYCAELLIKYGATEGFAIALDKALSNNNIRMAQLLIDNQPKLFTDNNDLRRDLFYKAQRSDNIKAAQFLIDNGFNINASISNEESLLYQSLVHSKATFSLFCLKNNANFTHDIVLSNYYRSDTIPPLLYILNKAYNAYSDDWVEVANVYIEKAVERNLLESEFRNAEEIIRLAALNSDKSILYNLLYYTNDGAYTFFDSEGEELSIVEYLKKLDFDIQISDMFNEETIEDELFQAIAQKDVNKVKELVAAKPELLNARQRFKIGDANFEKVSPLGHAVKSGSIPMVKFWWSQMYYHEVANSIFNIAIVNNDLEMLQFLIKNDDNFENNGKWILYDELHASPEIIEIFLKNGVDADEYIFNGQSFLFYAVRIGNVESINLFIKYSNKISEDYKALFKAIEVNDFKQVNKLIEKGIDLNNVNSAGLTPLVWAVYLGKYEMTKYLIEHGANVSITWKEYEDGAMYPRNGSAPIRWAVQKGYEDIVELLVSKHASPVVSLFLEENLNVFHLAANQGSHIIMQTLLNGYADSSKITFDPRVDKELADFYLNNNQVGVFDYSRTTPFDIAAYSGNISICKQFLELGLGVDNETKAEGKKYTPLYFAIQGSQVETARFLIDNGADFQTEKTADLLMDEAILNSNYEVIDLLVTKGILKNISSDKYNQMLLDAAYRQSLQTLKIFIEQGVAINVADNDGRTVLHKVMNSKEIDDKIEAVNCLINNGFHINAQDKDGLTALHLAAENNDLDLVQVLLDNHANINLISHQDQKEKTALDLATHYQLYKLLKTKGAKHACEI
jgi:ankyrin repeat protein